MEILGDLPDDYSSLDTAYHYHAFRPLLHARILSKILTDSNYGQGLDVGSGTGQSSLALLPFCEHIFGLEPSPIMLANAHLHERINYLPFDGVNLPLESRSISLITFAGSWPYAKSQKLLDELIRVSKQKAILVLYDFKVKLAPMDVVFQIPANDHLYNYQEDLSGLANRNFFCKKDTQINMNLRSQQRN